VYLLSGDGLQGVERDITEPDPLLFVGGMNITAAFGDAGDTSGSVKPIKKVTQVAPLSEAQAVKPPFPSPNDAWLIETKKVCL
jgi:hypothetical protein